MAYNHLAHETQGDYSLTKAERFEPPSKRPLYKVEFESRRKQSKESWADFGDELLVFASKAFPLLQDEPQKKLAFSKYLDQLSNPQVYFRVKQCHPKTINEPLAVLLNYVESYLVKSGNGVFPSSVSQVAQIHQEDQTIAAIQSRQDVIGVLEKLVGQVE